MIYLNHGATFILDDLIYLKMLATATKRKKFAQMSSQYSSSGRNIQNKTRNILEEDFNLVNVYKHCSNLTRMQKNMCGLSFLHLNIGTVETMFSSDIGC